MAEPLSILGGVAASIQLVECAATALLGTIKFIRDLREIPKKTASRVGDVERSSERVNYICRHILSSGSLTADHIGPDAVTRLSSFFETLRIAIDEAEAVLKSLIEASNSDKHTKALRLWSSLVSSTRESSILEKLRIVHQLNSELTIELEIVGLMTTAATRSTLNQTSSIIENHHAEALVHFDSMENTNASIAVSANSMRTQTSRINSDLSRIASTADSIHRHTSDIGSNMQSQLQMTHEKMVSMIHQQELKMSDELRSIRDEILRAVSGTESRRTETSHIGAASSDVHHLTQQDHVLLHDNMAISLMRYPTVMRDAWCLSVDNRKRLGHCLCQPRTARNITRIWSLRLESLRRSEHQQDCPLFGSGCQEWSNSMSASLHPFFNKVVEVSFGAITGPGVWTMLPPLKFLRTMRRSTSPIFQAFDNLLESCTEKEPSQPNTENQQSDSHQVLWARKTSFSLEVPCWKPGGLCDFPKAKDKFEISWKYRTGEDLEAINQMLRQNISHGILSGSESDENGFTVFFEFCNLLVLLGDQWKDFEPQLRGLLNTILRSNVNIQATTTFMEELRHVGIANYHSASWCCKQVTAASYLIDRKYMLFPYTDWEVPFHKDLSDAGAFEALDYDMLSLAIMKRSLDEVKVLARRIPVGSRTNSVSDDLNVSYLQLAIGWIEGIEFLVAEYFSRAAAERSACSARDAASLHALLDTTEKRVDASLEQLLYWSVAVEDDSSTIGNAVASGSRDVLRTLIMALRDRRMHLYYTALELLSATEIRQTNLTESTFLNGNAECAFKLLNEKLVSLFNISLNATFDIPPVDYSEVSSPYHFIDDPWQFNPRNASLETVADVLDVLYECGFVKVDEIDKRGETPMFAKIRRTFFNAWVKNHHPGAEDIAEWFVTHGASVINRSKVGWPNVLFYLAFSGSEKWLEWWSESWAGSNTKDAVRDLHLCSDTCRCYCSSYGCMSIHLLLRCYHRSRDRCVHYIGRIELSRRWIHKWDICDIQGEILMKEMTRLELFERLGMAHTCCRHVESSYGAYRGSFEVKYMSDSDQQLIQSDDAELMAQLECLMEHYEQWRSLFGGKSETFHGVWWNVVDDILPPLLPVEECYSLHRASDAMAEAEQEIFRANGRELREKREKEVLCQTGFEHFEDFQTVIKIHFKKNKLRIFGGRD